MKKYAAGFALGLGLGVAVTALAGVPITPSTQSTPRTPGIPSVTGGDGKLNGWTVIVKHKPTCKAPYVRVKEREIECVR